MTNSTHTYQAFLLGTPDVELSVRGGRITLDSGRAPHVDASIDVAVPAEAVLAALDPRAGARVRVEADAVFPSFSQSRTFDLGLRTRPVRHRDGVVTLDLASDEALLLDYFPLADDDAPLALAGSLRDVVDYVLDVAIPGAALEASPADDADVTPYWAATNYLENPDADSNVTHWSGQNCTVSYAGGTFDGISGYINAHTSTATTWRLWAQDSTSRGDAVTTVRPGDVLSAGARVRSGGGGGGAASAQLRIVFFNEAGYWLDGVWGEVTDLSSSQWLFTVGTAPVGAVAAGLVIYANGSVGGSVHVARAYLTDGPFDTGYFDGSEPDTTQYDHAWTDAANSSASIRQLLVDAPTPDALVWQAGQYALDFLQPLIQRAGLRLVCDEARRWTLRNATYTAPGDPLNIRRAVNMIDATDTLSRTGDAAWFDAAVTEYIWTDRNGVEQRRIDAYAAASPHTRGVRFEKRTPYPGAGFSQYAVERAQGRGRVVEATRVALWDSNAEQACQFVVAGAPIQTGKTDRITFDLDNDEMTATARTTDTPANAIDLVAGTINAQVGTINGT